MSAKCDAVVVVKKTGCFLGDVQSNRLGLAMMVVSGRGATSGLFDGSLGADGLNRVGRSHGGLRVGFSGSGALSILASRACRGHSSGRLIAKGAAARGLTEHGLRPALTSRSGAEVLLKCDRGVDVDVVSGRWKTVVPPDRSGILVLRRSKLTSSLRLLLERLLLLGIGIADLNLHFFTGRCDGVIVEGLDDLLTRVTILKTGRQSAKSSCRWL